MHNLELNKEKAVTFYKMAFEGNPREAVRQFVGNEYIQHNPHVGNGKEAFIRYFEKMSEDYGKKDIEFVRSVAEGDLVALHTHQVWENEGEYITMDFFRFAEDGKIVEHWDAVQRVPRESANGNTMY